MRKVTVDGVTVAIQRRPPGDPEEDCSMATQGPVVSISNGGVTVAVAVLKSGIGPTFTISLKCQDRSKDIQLCASDLGFEP